MRMRKKKHLEDRLADVSSLYSNLWVDTVRFDAGEAPKYLDFAAIFGNDNPVHLEIGCGKGRFTAVVQAEVNGEVVEKYGVCVKEIVATGGCSNSDKWMQIKADIQNIPVRVLRSHEGGLCGCAMLSAVAKRLMTVNSRCQLFL